MHPRGRTRNQNLNNILNVIDKNFKIILVVDFCVDIGKNT